MDAITKLKVLSNFDEEEYYIMNKDTVLCSFIWNEVGDVSVDPQITSGIENLPAFISKDLYSWLDSRTPPKHRAHMKELLDVIGCKSIKSIIDFSKGLSLTDTLWVKKSNSEIEWDKINLYDNEFDEVISKIAFNGGLYGHVISTTSPEFGTNGMLPKCWVRGSDGYIYLKKGGTEGARNAGFEPYSENLASQLLDKLEYNHVNYSVEQFRGKLVSSCRLITSKEVSMIPIYMLCDETSIFGIVRYYDSIGCKDEIIKMLIFDYLILNSDRHANNFAVLVNSDTFEPISMAPIYDNGVGVLNYYMLDGDINDYVSNYIPALYDSYEDVVKYYKNQLTSKHNVNKLVGFKFDRSQVKGYSGDKITFIENFIQDRVQQFLVW